MPIDLLFTLDFSFQVFWALLMAVPLKKCFELIKRCPALILASIFTHWTFGPIKSPQNQKSCKNFAFRNGKIGVSYFYTSINIMIKLLVTLFIIVYYYLPIIVHRIRFINSNAFIMLKFIMLNTNT